MESRAVEFRSPRPAEGRSRGSKESNPAADRYHRKTGIYANRAQRKLLADQVSDLTLWEAILEHWLAHGWNPRNVAGQLQLYHRGGPNNCPFCQRDRAPLDQTLDVLAQLRKELTNG